MEREAHGQNWEMKRSVAALTVISAVLAGAACGSSSGHPEAQAVHSPTAPAMALGGTGSVTGHWSHLDAGTYRITLKADGGGQLQDEALMRHRVGAPGSDGTYTNDQAPIVAFLTGAGDDVEVLPAGDYVLVVIGLDQYGWSLTVTRES